MNAMEVALIWTAGFVLLGQAQQVSQVRAVLDQARSKSQNGQDNR